MGKASTKQTILLLKTRIGEVEYSIARDKGRIISLRKMIVRLEKGR